MDIKKIEGLYCDMLKNIFTNGTSILPTFENTFVKS